MLIARALTRDKTDLLLLGLSAANRRSLLLGSPLDLTLTTRHGPLKIVIFAGETEESMQVDLFALLDATSTITKIQEAEEEA